MLELLYNEGSVRQTPGILQRTEGCKITLPENGTILPFKNDNHKMRVPIVVYVDFECFTEKIVTCQPDPEQSFTKQHQKHEPSGFCYYIV